MATDLKISQLPGFVPPIASTDLFALVQNLSTTPVTRKISYVTMFSQIRTDMGKTELATGYSLAGGTAVRTLTVTANSTIDQNLQTTASPLFSALTVTNAGNFGSTVTIAATLGSDQLILHNPGNPSNTGLMFQYFGGAGGYGFIDSLIAGAAGEPFFINYSGAAIALGFTASNVPQYPITFCDVGGFQKEAVFNQISTPATPSSAAKLYAKTVAGLTSIFTLNSAGAETIVGGGGVTSFNTRTGAVTSQSGDYTAAQVTNAADKNATSTQVFNGPITTGFTSGGGNLTIINGNVIAGAGGGTNSGDLTTIATDTSEITLFANPNTSPFSHDIYNVACGQASQWVLPDPGTASATNFIIANSAGTQTIVTGNLSLSAGNLTAKALVASGLTGATAASRYVGATASGAPVSGTFAKGDYVIDQTGIIWVCTTAGSPGTFTQSGGTNYWTQSGGVLQPVTAGQILRNTGHIETTNGNIRAGNGGPGNSGDFSSYANDGSSLFFNCAPNSSILSNILTNASTGQSSEWILPDPGTGTSTNIIIANSAGTQTIATGNLKLSAGFMNFGAIATPSTPTTSANVYAKTVSGTTGLYGQDSTGTEFLLTQAAGAGYWSVFSDIVFLTASTTYTKIHLGAIDTSTLAFVSNPNTAVYLNTLQNAATGQATTWNLPDPGVASVSLLVSDSAGKIVRTGSANGGPVLPLTVAPVTVSFTAFPTSIDSVAISWKETTSGVPVTVKEISRTSSSVTFEIANLSATTATGTVTVTAIATGH